jgi:hypothetical protein
VSDSSIDNSNVESGDLDAKLETVGKVSELAVIFSNAAGVRMVGEENALNLVCEVKVRGSVKFREDGERHKAEGIALNLFGEISLSDMERMLSSSGFPHASLSPACNKVIQPSRGMRGF